MLLCLSSLHVRLSSRMLADTFHVLGPSYSHGSSNSTAITQLDLRERFCKPMEKNDLFPMEINCSLSGIFPFLFLRSMFTLSLRKLHIRLSYSMTGVFSCHFFYCGSYLLIIIIMPYDRSLPLTYCLLSVSRFVHHSSNYDESTFSALPPISR